MAGKIKDEDIALVRERTAIADVISEHVTLKSAGGGNLKGLCPFHDEKTASFNVSPARNVYFCHGCGAGGDAIKFLMDHDHLSFVESVERLAGRAGLQLQYVEAGSAPVRQTGQKQRLIAAHAEAARFYAEHLGSPGARLAREFLAQRGFGREEAERYGCGFAPEGWDPLSKHLRLKGYTAQELITAGLSKEARSGSLIDRFRRRLLWPIKDISGDVIGFGARKLFADDDGPKYLNTPESPLYKKSHVLYGVDQAKREIAKQSKVVIVEGYTDVMACHLSDVPVAVATCGTAFGADHIAVLRRLLLDADGYGGEIIFTFDGDAAGQKAALRAFEDDQRFVAQTFIAVGPNGMDPCELRMAKGPVAVRDLVADRQPLLDFALRSVIQRFDLDTAEGRVGALKATAPLVAKIKDRTLRPEYARKLAGDLGMELETVQRSVGAAAKGIVEAPAPPPRKTLAPDSAEALVEREALKLALQLPALAGPMFDVVGADIYAHPTYAALRTAIADAGGASSATAGAVWIERVREACTDPAAGGLVTELAVEPLRLDGEPDPRYVEATVVRLQLPAINRRIADLKSKQQRINPVTNADEYLRLFSELVSLEQHARALRDRSASRW
ncbi:DNA primase [Dactylosporangium siamense]|uniref:DNA primase n=1 Tax=Dactylosporangium siamense TaxID=685454 RepID=A0A919UCQ8_9ACTN|nr:DNA primase [Dactylosporangium siamense]GIG45883.1 DNA primase [Dactylosporangium siamense]